MAAPKRVPVPPAKPKRVPVPPATPPASPAEPSTAGGAAGTARGAAGTARGAAGTPASAGPPAPKPAPRPPITKDSKLRVLLAGASGMPVRRVAVAAALGSLPAALLYAVAGAVGAGLASPLTIAAGVVLVTAVTWGLGAVGGRWGRAEQEQGLDRSPPA